MREVIEEMKQQKIQVLLSTTYYDRNQVEEIAARTGAKAVIVPGNAGAEGADSYFDLITLWIRAVAKAFGAAPAASQ